jgi:ATP-binding protein involved in chromosome partitioning
LTPPDDEDVMSGAQKNQNAPRTRTPGADRLPGVEKVIAVGSGKGGVGKSTVAVNLAISLAGLGARVGLLDGDIYGPSIPILLGLKNETPKLDEVRRKILPLSAHGISCVSMGFLLKSNDAVVWRGPMLGKALQQFVDDVDWGELDYLVVDLPPGTGDVQLSLAQLLSVHGAILVTTPQDVAHDDVARAARMFDLLHVPMIGLVENMAYFLCPDNGKTYPIFGQGRTKAFAEQLKLDLLASFPLDLGVAPSGDAGIPITISQPDGDQSGRYRKLAQSVATRIAAMEYEHEEDGVDQVFPQPPAPKA